MISPGKILLFALLLSGATVSPVQADDKGIGDEEASANPPAQKENTPEVEIHGIDGALLKNVRAHLSLGREACGTPPWRIRWRYGQADTDIRQALRALGYYGPLVEKHLIPPCSVPDPSGKATPPKTPHEDCKEGCWSARFTIDPGSPVRIETLQVTIRGEAAEDPAFHAPRAALPMGKGDILNHAHYGGIKDDIAALAAGLGYFDGRFTDHELRVDARNLQARIHLAYDSGPRYRFGELQIDHESLDSDFIRRIIGWREGDPFDAQKLVAMHRHLADSGYFASVEVRPRRLASRDRRVPVDVHLTPRKRYRFSFGLGATTDSGPSGSFSVLDRRFNRRGDRWSSDTTISPVKSDITTEYRIPLADPRTDWLSLQGGYQREDTETAESRGLRLGVRHARRYANDWLGILSLDALREDFMTGATDDVSTMVVAGVGFSHGDYDDRIRPRRGHRLDLKLNMSHPMLGSDTGFIQGHASGKWVRGLSWGGRIILRGELGISWVDEFGELPVSYRFFAGGDKSIRGYGFHALGPRDDRDDIIGGSHMVVGSLEYEHPVARDWALAAFVDHGNALDDGADLLGAALKTGVGVGVRWFSPFGPVGVDFGFPLDEDSSTVRLHLKMGIDW
uniref:Translocation and assembly module subunit TamA n=1 Tax=Candidatus Kentrum eta TaxID=2126337 RepID=A0A450UTJ3_9GAMM|nr:MAG: translocation and assembly module TamA [Candidatus Kentron sp. H]VFJ89300.1 MAG: translocation and assembly module TamA [Candidatus Kentron sp. H]VFJ95893.1 MAG: translocation and assembly module TamA [Candidatus Kentron sp. H]